MSKADLFIEGYHSGSVICDGCNTEIDLSDAENLIQAKRTWNTHIRHECRSKN